MNESGLVFVVQKHKATSLHYDFRLEMGGGMPSWSIPKGPSLDPSVRRLAMPTPVHELEYRNFEGVLPEGYGAGPVMIWDEGTYNAEQEIAKGIRSEITDRKKGEKVMEEGLKAGNLKFHLFGKKLQGSFVLVRTAGFGGSNKESWLMIKHRDQFAQKGYAANEYDVSARSGKSMKEIAASAQTQLD
jgi:bifunctional non-homologous end joining protein LigD